MPPRTVRCKDCPIVGGTHNIPARLQIPHALEIQRVREQNNTGSPPESTTALAGLVSALSLTPSRVVPSVIEPDQNVAHLADLVTGLVLTDDGPNPHEQPSKLFSPRDEFQEMRAPEIPDEFRPISASDASRSITTLLAHQIPTFLKNAKGRPILEKVEEDVRAALQSLDMSFNKEKPEEVAAMHNILNAAAGVVTAASESLKALAGNSHLRELRIRVVSDIQVLDQHINVISGRLPKVPGVQVAGPMRYNSVHVFSNPIADLDLVAQMTLLLVVICNVVIGVGTNPCNFILETLKAIIQLTMSLNVAPGDEHDAQQLFVLDQLPTNLHAALQAFQIDSKTTVYAVCPSCSFTHEPKEDKATGALIYPAVCQNIIIGRDGPEDCGEALLEERHNKMRPLKTYVFASFEEYIARLLADPKLEEMCDKACDDAMASLGETPESVTNVFEAKFMKTFEGPQKNKLFIDRGDRMRLAFEVQLDFFNPNGTRKRGNHDSIGILSVALMNLPANIRYKPENLYVSIIPGTKEPDVEEITYYVRPLVDVFVVGWERGLHFSSTGRSSAGRDVDLAIIISVNDLPAARKMAGAAGTSSHFFCTVCNCYHLQNVWKTDFENWTRRDVNSLRENAFAWKNATTAAARQKIFDASGQRWSEVWRLIYWDPTRMLVIDGMHCVLEGIVKYHCRYILRLDATVAKEKENKMAFSYNWIVYDPSILEPKDILSEPEERDNQIPRLQKKLQEAIVAVDSAEPGTDIESMRTALAKSFNKRPLRFVTNSLRLHVASKETKMDYANALIEWRLTMPLTDPDFTPKAINLNQLKYVQRVISKTATPSWINSVPKNYGESSAGTIKADEWRTLSTIYIPIALVILWGDQPEDDAERLLAMLKHSMALFQAVTLVCRYSSSLQRANAYREFIREWVDGLVTNHPHSSEHHARVNIHAAFHIYDFILLFGPIMAWWCFPFERLIGALQKINKNNHIGGELEATIVKSFWRGANLRRYLNRVDCPEVIKQFKILFDLTFSPHNDKSAESVPAENDKDRAHYTHQGANYSRASTHLGNSLVLYYPSSNATSPIAGSIQRIETAGDDTIFHIQRQGLLPANKFDPFLPYPHFPAKTYSSLMENIFDKVQPSSILSHCARFEFSDNRAVILNLSRD